MSFRLWTIFYVFALLAAAMASFGVWGIGMVIPILGFWALIFSKWFSLKSGIVSVLVIGFLVFINSMIVIPAIFRSYGPSYRNSCSNNLKSIAFALLAYEAKNGKLPPAYVADASGNRVHSWRVQILPYLERPELFAAYDFSEPWNGPNNSKLASQMSDVFRCPGRWEHDDGRVFSTSYVAIVDQGTDTVPFFL